MEVSRCSFFILLTCISVYTSSGVQTSKKDVHVEVLPRNINITKETPRTQENVSVMATQCHKTTGETTCTGTKENQWKKSAEMYHQYEKHVETEEAHNTKDERKRKTSDVKDCSGSPCENEGTCLDNPIGYTCVCLNGFEGERCEYDNAEVKVEAINKELGIFDDELKEDVKVVSRMIAQTFDEKNPEMKKYLRSLIPRVLSSLLLPSDTNSMDKVLEDIFSHFMSNKREYVKNTLYSVLKILYEDHDEDEREDMIHTILTVTDGVEYADSIIILLERIFHSLKK